MATPDLDRDGRDIVFVFGAGVSHEYGGPLVNRFLDVSERAITRFGSKDEREALGRVLEARAALRSAQANTQVNLDNIEEFFTTLQMADTVGTKIGRASKDLVADAQLVIAKTVDYSVLLPCQPDGQLIPAGNTGNALKRLLSNLKANNLLHRCSFLTFNYDLSFEVEAFNLDIDCIYYEGQPPSSNPRGEQVPLIKMHGSSSWLQCWKHKKPIIYSPWSFISQKSETSDRVRPVQTDAVHKQGGDFGVLNRHVHDNCASLRPYLPPYIIPPTWYKSPQSTFEKETWKQAANIFYGAQHIVLAGYSWPASDHFFRQLFALGSLDGKFIKSFHVIRPVQTWETLSEVNNHYSQMLGPATKDRYALLANTFKDAVNGGFIENHLKPSM